MRLFLSKKTRFSPSIVHFSAILNRNLQKKPENIKDEDAKIRNRKADFVSETNARYAVIPTMISTFVE